MHVFACWQAPVTILREGEEMSLSAVKTTPKAGPGQAASFIVIARRDEGAWSVCVSSAASFLFVVHSRFACTGWKLESEGEVHSSELRTHWS